jgi:hypothetical protein
MARSLPGSHTSSAVIPSAGSARIGHRAQTLSEREHCRVLALACQRLEQIEHLMAEIWAG